MTAAIYSAADYEPIDPRAFPYPQRYKLFTGSVIPRPIAFVTSRHADGHINAAPFSQFIIIAVEPGLLGFSVGPDARGIKDTLANIRSHPQFVINTVSEALAVQVQTCSENFPPEISEVEQTGLHLIPSTKIDVPRIAESRIQFECTLHSITPFGASHLVVGEVLAMHALKGLVADCKIDTLAFEALGRIGGRNYCKVSDVIAV
jgi:flavin reductase (DIM6/NTAB) family NADH-FMN oxidoreductase RutF